MKTKFKGRCYSFTVNRLERHLNHLLIDQNLNGKMVTAVDGFMKSSEVNIQVYAPNLSHKKDAKILLAVVIDKQIKLKGSWSFS